MDSITLLLGILPLIAFVIVDSFFGLKAGLLSAIFFAVLEAFLSWHWFGELDHVTAISVGLVLFFALLSLKFKSELYIKLQPSILSFVLGPLLMITYIKGEPIFLDFLLKYRTKLPQHLQIQIENPFFQELVSLYTLYAGIALILFGLVMIPVAIKLNKWWWLGMRGVGFYFFLLMALFAVRIHLSFIYVY
jgi:intracellular septation protein